MLQRLLIPEWWIDGWQDVIFQLTHKSKYVVVEALHSDYVTIVIWVCSCINTGYVIVIKSFNTSGWYCLTVQLTNPTVLYFGPNSLQIPVFLGFALSI